MNVSMERWREERRLMTEPELKPALSRKRRCLQLYLSDTPTTRSQERETQESDIRHFLPSPVKHWSGFSGPVIHILISGLVNCIYKMKTWRERSDRNVTWMLIEWLIDWMIALMYFITWRSKVNKLTYSKVN